ncbi:acyl-CoA thioesterase [Streptococcus dentiloxodontae]
MTPHMHKVQYYETDRMGITHHSNYIRWMEEARGSLLEQIGFPYYKLEELGVISPVTSVTCDYKSTSTYADIIAIDVSVAKVKAARLSLAYTMTNQEGTLVCQANSEHSFLSKNGSFVNLKKDYPLFYEKLVALSH